MYVYLLLPFGQCNVVTADFSVLVFDVVYHLSHDVVIFALDHFRQTIISLGRHRMFQTLRLISRVKFPSSSSSPQKFSVVFMAGKS